MRVSSNSFPNALIGQLGALALKQARFQQQAASGQRIQKPDDDPAAMRRVMELQAEAKAVSQFDRNIAVQRETATRLNGVLKSLKQISDRAGEIATLADGLKSPEQLAIYANEIDEMIKHGVLLANTTHRGSHLLAGTRNDRPPFSATSDQTGLVTAVAYGGNGDVNEIEVAEGTRVAVLSPGANATGSGERGLLSDTRAGADLFAHLISLRDHLRAGDTDAIAATDRVALAKDEENFIHHFGRLGAVLSRLEASAAASNARSVAVEAEVSREVDADLAQTIVRLNETQNAYRAALQTAGSMLNQSLLDYLR